MAASPRKARGARGGGRRGASAGPPEPGPVPDGGAAADAAAKLGAGSPIRPAEQPPSDAVADAPGPALVQIGGRAFRVGPRDLAGRRLDVLPDLPDIRDRIYQPHLRHLRPAVVPRIAFPVRDQHGAMSCTGHALAHVIDLLLGRPDGPDGPDGAGRVSARMLYEMAKLNDEWAGSAYEGSSVRGCITGFYRNGVCRESEADEAPDVPWTLDRRRAQQARETRLGAFYRLAPDIADYHAALNEIGAILASAQIHMNWAEPETGGRIRPGGVPAGGHAFAIVGYDATGFHVLNSWGPDWGQGGLAHWRYEDWAATVMDAWVLQLGVRAPTAFSAVPRRLPASAPAARASSAPTRTDIFGHFINIDDGRYVTGGRYGSPSEDELKGTAARVLDPDANEGAGYQHVVIYAHGGLNSQDDEANRIATWKRNKVFSRNGLYPFHLMWDTFFLDEAFGELSKAQAERAGGFLGDVLLETVLKPIGARAWLNMKRDARAAFTEGSGFDGGMTGLRPLLRGLDVAGARPKLHLVGHSAGAILLGHLLANLNRAGLQHLDVESVHLLAPACTTSFFAETYGPYLAGRGGRALRDKVYLYNLRDGLELRDHVLFGGPLGYGRSLLYLVSRAYEEKPGMPLAGMERFRAELPRSRKLAVDYSDGVTGTATRATRHGDFDNDVETLSTIMARIRGGGPLPHPPVANELVGY